MADPVGRSAALATARARDSQDKRRRALDAVEALEAAGGTITFPAVAEAAGVSSWLVYARGVRESIEAARQRQAGRSNPTPGDQPGGPSPAPAGLRTELALARAEIKSLRAERDKLLQRLRLRLGADIEGPQRTELIARVADLQAVNRQLVADRDARRTEADTGRSRIHELEDELTAARESLRRMIRSENRAP